MIWIAEEENNLDRYHAAMDDLVSDYFESGRFEKEINTIYSLIEPYQAKDPTAFFPPEEFKNDYQDLKTFCMERAAGVRDQLNEN
jgi:Ni,Fe-hydrogenase III component G